ncbi:MAG TPA: transglutaminase-like domain-containing protein [Nocardioides sp.]|nr:transglutaminase-like domain-containing protein [Nocardioides sp.]
MRRVAAAFDHVLPVVLTVVVLSGWSTTYVGGSWLETGVVASASAVAMASWLARRDWGADAVVLAIMLAYVLAAAPVASLPIGSDLFGTIARGTVHGWTYLVGSHPYLDDRGVLLLPALGLGLLVGGLAATTALRGRSPGAPCVVPVLAFALVQLLGRDQPHWGQGLALAVACTAWIFVRGLASEVRIGAGPALLRFAVAAVVLTLVGLVTHPLTGPVEADTGPRVVLRDEVPAYDVSELDTPLRTFRDFTRQPPSVPHNVFSRPLLTVSGLPAGTRLRFVALDRYDGLVFHADDRTVPGTHEDRYLRVNGPLDTGGAGRSVFARVTLRSTYRFAWLPTAGALRTVDFTGNRITERASELRYNPATRTAVMTRDVTPDDSYDFTAVLTDDTLTSDMLPYRGVDADLYRSARFVELPALGWSRGATSRMDAVFRAARVLRTTGRYSDGGTLQELKYAPGHDARRLGVQFIHGSLTGDDEQYATTMALVATRLGVPARVVVGAIVPRSGVVRGADVHAWVELRVRDGSWRTLPTARFMSRTPPEVDRFETNPDQTIRLPPGTRLPQVEPQFPKPLRRHVLEEPHGSPLDLGAWARRAGVVLGLLVLLGVGAIPVAKWRRRRARRVRPRVTARYAGAWAELVDTATDLGLPVRRSATRQAQAAAMGLGEELAWEADLVVFGMDQPTEEAAVDYWSRVVGAERTLRAGASWLRRVLAPLNPASLHLRLPAVLARLPRRQPVGTARGVTSLQTAKGSSPVRARATARGGSGRE